MAACPAGRPVHRGGSDLGAVHGAAGRQRARLHTAGLDDLTHDDAGQLFLPTGWQEITVKTREADEPGGEIPPASCQQTAFIQQVNQTGAERRD